jgi:hypothetical protein
MDNVTEDRHAYKLAQLQPQPGGTIVAIVGDKLSPLRLSI